MDLSISKYGYTPKQLEILDAADSGKYKSIFVPKGRRFGFTQSMSNFVIEKMIEKKITVLWGDTIASNIKKYVELFWMPILKQLKLPNNEKLYEIKMYEGKEIKIRNTEGGWSNCDFRSADRPENWEGFGYDLAILNEAGIILKNRSLWENSVRPMLLDNPNSLIIVGGTPKGKKTKDGLAHKYYELCRAAKDNPRHIVFPVTSYDNPLLDTEALNELQAEVREESGSEIAVRQEIFGEFVDLVEDPYIPYETVKKAVDKKYHISDYDNGVTIMGIDFASRRDENVICTTRGMQMIRLDGERPHTDNWQLYFANKIIRAIDQDKPDRVFLDMGEAGSGILNRLKEFNYGHYITGVNFAARADDPIRYANKRADMYGKLKEWLDNGGSIFDDPVLISELSSIRYDYKKETQIILQSKSQLISSPNRADALALTRAYPVRKKNKNILMQRNISSRRGRGKRSWADM